MTLIRRAESKLEKDNAGRCAKVVLSWADR